MSLNPLSYLPDWLVVLMLVLIGVVFVMLFVQMLRD